MIYPNKKQQGREDFYIPKDPITALKESHQRNLNYYISEKDKEEIIEKSIQGVLERLSVTIDVEKAIQEIEELKEQIESLYSIFLKGGY